MTASRRAWQRPVLRTDEEFQLHRSVGWLELFFDLIFVVVISRLAHHLAVHLHMLDVVKFVVQFVAVFWVWNAFTYYTERFESDGMENRLFTFLAMVPVAGLAIFADEGLGATYVGFALAYLVARTVNQATWARAARHVPAFRPTAIRFLCGHLVVTAIILGSFAAQGSTRWVLFAVAVVLDIATPYFTTAQQAVLPKLSTSKFPERFGQLTMIVLGEAVVGVIVGLSGLAEHGQLGGSGIGIGLLGLAVGFALWWLYFDFVARRTPRPLFITALGWVYLHLLTLTAITVTGAGISVVITDAAAGSLSNPSRYLLVSGVALSLLGIGALQTTLTRTPDEPTHARLSPALHITAAVVTASLGALDLGWNAGALLAMLLVGLALPMAYGAFVWFTPTANPLSEP
jgi:low temperature requirement protein LtrA